jgi:hypothetical protein
VANSVARADLRHFAERSSLRTLRPLCCSRAPVNPEEHLGSPRQRLLLFSAAFANEPLSRGYFPRDVFFFGLGLLVLPVLPGAASFFGRFGDTDSLLPSLAIRSRLRAAAPSPPAGRSARRYRSASPAWQSTEPSHPRPETAIVNGCRKRARPAKVARRCVALSSSRATAVSRLSQQTTRQEKGSPAADQATPS